MARPLQEINAEYAKTSAQVGEKTYLTHLKSEELELLSQEKEKLLNKMKNLAREAWAVMNKDKIDAAKSLEVPEVSQAVAQVEVAQDAVGVTNEAL